MCTVAVFVELVVVSVGGKSCAVVVLVLRCWWEQCVEVLVALVERDFVKET